MAEIHLRKKLRTQRRSLSSAMQLSFADQIASILTSQDFFLRAKRIGIYLANDGEVNPSIILDICKNSSKQCFLPAVHPLKINRLHFAQYKDNSVLTTNRFGIFEPCLKQAKISPPWSLDLILMPLVGFDRSGNRLGMGGGFYDRTLAFMAKNNKPSPQLVGLAYSFQEIAQISPQKWDIPVSRIITEKEIIGGSLR